jgi:hypothetical protein
MTEALRNQSSYPSQSEHYLSYPSWRHRGGFFRVLMLRHLIAQLLKSKYVVTILAIRRNPNTIVETFLT